ncbi:MAG TPA: hypothetical protein VK936_09085 [Longimicrobiales bacterium]|nr:hypothetical protein [Longimicrobiales bacterium]
MRRWLMAFCVPLLAAACDQETPTSVGGGLLPPDGIRTFEVIIEPERYLVFDTAFGMYSDASSADFLVVAREFEGVVNANILARFVLPTAVAVRDSGDVLRTDTTPAYAGGRLRLLVDTLQSTTGTARLALYRTAEVWHPTATWASRIDTLGTSQPWQQPGGTRGVLVDTASYTAGQDTVVFNVDAATMAEWADTTIAERGALIVMETAGGRLRAFLPTMDVDMTSDINPDTVVIQPAFLSAATFMFDPTPPELASDPRVGGTPAWRTVLRLQERLDTLTVPCPGVPGCRLTLDQVTINYAAFQLQPVPPPPGMRPEGPMNVGVFLLLPSDLVPLHRSPVGDFISSTAVPATRFTSPGTPLVQIPITEYLRLTTRPGPDTPELSRHLVLSTFDQRTFGFATFAAMPSLRLVLSIAQEMQLP